MDGLGGLGHMGVKIAHALGAHVIAFTTSACKKEDACPSARMKLSTRRMLTK
jgi:D-arabinose 1-dehydrogenase-like Zn-dependent alcohol dehydrogenase